MKFNIRHSIFETNSSSTHALSVYKDDNPIDVPEVIKINLSDYEFGWQREKFNDLHSKFAYLYLIITEYSEKDEKKLLESKLKALCQAVGVKEFIITDDSNNSWSYGGYIDHGGETYEFLVDLLNEPSLLYGFLFNSASIIETGNDNDDYMPEIERGCDYGYIKGN